MSTNITTALYTLIIMIIMYIYHALINDLSVHTIYNINLNTIFYKHVEHSPTKTIYVRYYMETHARSKMASC